MRCIKPDGFIDWPKLGVALRLSTFGAPSVHVAYSFMTDNPECFVGSESWLFDMPTEPPAALVAAYYQITPRHAELWLTARRAA